jgi:Na+-transporting methylmalonyl-CoA/oxaloacetate decarboxylase gamma subunit
MSILTGSGVAGVFCVLFIIGIIFPRGVVEDLREENKELKAALESERERANAAVTAATATRDILAAIQYGRDLTAGHGP